MDAPSFDRDVVIVGGGPTGCSAGVFVSRYGLDAALFDRGNSSLRRCAHLENYLGFPGGIDVETLYDLMHAHAREAGCDIVPEMVVSVDRPEGEETGFVVETQEGRRVTAARVVAASRYDGEYLRPLGGDEMFTTYEDDAEEYFDLDYADDDGRTPVDGLYVAAPAGEHNWQAITSAAHGARVARTLVGDVRTAAGYPESMASRVDWVRREATLEDEWEDRDRWREWFDGRVPDDHGLDDERLTELREADVDRRLATYISEAEVRSRSERGLRRLVETLGPERVLDAVDDERIRDYLGDGRDASRSN
jgi:hypothetical protein